MLDGWRRAPLGRAVVAYAPGPRTAAPNGAAARGLGSLPDELKLAILAHSGPNPFVLSAMQQVDRSWHALAQDHSLWAPLYPQALLPACPPRPSELPFAPQAHFSAYMSKANNLKHHFFGQLWRGNITAAHKVAGSHDPVFACHAALALGPAWSARWDWHLQANMRRCAVQNDSVWVNVTLAATSLGAFS